MSESCPFCTRSKSLVAENTSAVAFRDSFPIAESHTLVIPRRHVASLFDLSTEEQSALWELVAQVRADLAATYAPDGFTVGLNDGVAAGQTVMHAHVHVIPRWSNDVEDPRGGIRWVIPDKANYWKK